MGYHNRQLGLNPIGDLLRYTSELSFLRGGTGIFNYLLSIIRWELFLQHQLSSPCTWAKFVPFAKIDTANDLQEGMREHEWDPESISYINRPN